MNCQFPCYAQDNLLTNIALYDQNLLSVWQQLKKRRLHLLNKRILSSTLSIAFFHEINTKQNKQMVKIKRQDNISFSRRVRYITNAETNA
jgi:hypothetical protein